MSTRVSAAGSFRKLPRISSFIRRSPVVLALAFAAPAFGQTQVFTPGNLVVLVEGCGVYGGTCTSVPNGSGKGSLNSSVGGYGDNQASPITLFQFTPNNATSASYAGSFVLPQASAGVNNLPVSGEYGSSSEGTLQLSGDGKYLTFMSYGLPAATYNANPLSYGPVNALAQSTSVLNQSTYTPVPRVVTLVDAYGTVKSSTALYNVFDQNNPRSVYSPDGQQAWVSGQGNSPDHTGGVFYTALGSPNGSPSPVTGNDTTSNTYTQDTRAVSIVNGQLYVSVDSKAGSGAARSYVGALGTPGNPPTTAGSTGSNPPVMLKGFGNNGGTGQVAISSASPNNGNGLNAGQTINLSPNGYFFASPSVLYVADTGNGKQTSAASKVGNGGLQKWINSVPDGSGTWSLAYTLSAGLNLVQNPTANPTGTPATCPQVNPCGTTGLYALTGQVVNGNVLLYATDYVINDLDTTHLFGISDVLSYTTPSQATAETFTTLATAPQDSNFKGVAFAPAPPPGAVGFTVESSQVGPAAQFVTLAATGSFTGGLGYPTAPISFQVGNGPVIPAGCGAYGYTGYCTVNYPVASIAPGANPLTVQYAGDSAFATVTASGVVNLTGSQSFVGINVSGASANSGTATVPLSVTASWPSGPAPSTAAQAYFQVDNGTKLGISCVLNPPSYSSATCTANYPTASLAPGFHAINFVLPGDSNFQQSVGSSTLFLK